MRTLTVMTILAVLILPPVVFAETQTYTATHTYILGDRDSKEDARQRCMLEAKRKVLEQAGVYIESVSEVNNFDLTKDKITSFAAAVMQVKDTKEEVGFRQGHMTLTIKLTAQVDLTEVRKQLATQQVYTVMREDGALLRERLKSLEAQLELLWQQQIKPISEHGGVSSTAALSPAEFNYLRAQAIDGNVEAQFALGVLYDKGIRGVPQDNVMARQWYEKAEMQGDARAKYCLGMMYAFGKGVKQDELRARELIEQVAVQGLPAAERMLGIMYVIGMGVPQNNGQGQSWLEKAATQNDSDAQYWLGKIYDEGIGVPQDYVMARRWYEQAAAQGDYLAQFKLGRLYSLGRGIGMDFVHAARWYQKSSLQGYAAAQLSLGDLYSAGSGVAQNYEMSRHWYREALRNGEVDAGIRLSAMYANGEGVRKDAARAYMWKKWRKCKQ